MCLEVLGMLEVVRDAMAAEPQLGEEVIGARHRKRVGLRTNLALGRDQGLDRAAGVIHPALGEEPQLVAQGRSTLDHPTSLECQQGVDDQRRISGVEDVDRQGMRIGMSDKIPLELRRDVLGIDASNSAGACHLAADAQRAPHTCGKQPAVAGVLAVVETLYMTGGFAPAS